MDSQLHTPVVEPIGNVHSTPQRKQWCFTLFYTEEGRDIQFPSELTSRLTYLVCQRESCPDTGRTHVQGFVAFARKVRFTIAKDEVQRLFSTNSSPRMAYIRGSVSDNVRYCTKVDTRLAGTDPIIIGEQPPDSGKPKGVATKLARDLILKGVTPKEVLQSEEYQDAWSIALRSPVAWQEHLDSLQDHRSILDPPRVMNSVDCKNICLVSTTITQSPFHRIEQINRHESII